MRCAARAGLLVLAGCNQVFGIGKTEPRDGSVDVIANDPIVSLALQVGGKMNANGTPNPGVEDVVISPAPTVRYAALRGAWKDATYRADGSVEVVQDLFERVNGGPPALWRFEYTLDGDVHEVQWNPEDKAGHIAIPRFGQQARMSPPAGSGYDVMPAGLDQLNNPRVFTLGRWTEGVATNANPVVRYDFASAVSMSGSVGAPQPAEGDQALIVNFADLDGDSCRVATGSTVLASAELKNNMHSTPAAVWNAGKTDATIPKIAGDASYLTRFGTGISILTTTTTAGALQYGFVISAKLPGLTGVPASPRLPITTALATPAMVTLLSCPLVAERVYTLKRVNRPIPLEDGFSPVLHAQLYASRIVNGIALLSGMAGVAVVDSPTGLTPVFPAAIPRGVELEIGGTKSNLITGADGAMISGGQATLTITPEATPGTGADYYDVVLHRLDSAAGGLTTERVYTVTVPQVEIEDGTLKSGNDYVFEIRAYRGHPQASIGDFRTVAFPYGSVQLFTRTFHIKP